ncbi:winged helix-turn-helix domain-containing protein [Streptomyces sp. NPDC049952]|uniref:winged helix-turn-helix domain-containing protein n=1 Tax=Streptomyces sp. NPDC049952 TaxID=3156665 RepID=UPI0034292F94
MDRETVTLNDLIKSRLDEIAEDAWENHRVVKVDSAEARYLEVGSGAVIERWRCQQNHGSGPCGEPMVPDTEYSVLLACPDDIPLFPGSMKETATVYELNADFGFTASELVHFSDITAAYQKFHGCTQPNVDKLVRLRLGPVARLAALHLWIQEDPQTTAEVAKALGVTPKTALKALTELQDDGRARKVHSVWTYQAAF